MTEQNRSQREGEEVGRAALEMWGENSLECNSILNALESPCSLKLALLSKHICFIFDCETDYFFLKF